MNDFLDNLIKEKNIVLKETDSNLKLILFKNLKEREIIINEKDKSSSEKIKLKSLVTLRNDFAHGSPITATISEVIDYFDSGRTILEWIDEIMYPPST